MVGKRISQLRRDRNMTQKELAKALNVSPSAIGMYEQGRRQPSTELIVSICRLFSVSTQWLLTGEPYVEENLEMDLMRLLAGNHEQQAPEISISREMVQSLLQSLCLAEGESGKGEKIG